MFQIRNWRPIFESSRAAPPCSNCGLPMHLDQVVLRSGGLSDQTFKCEQCWVTEEVTSNTARVADDDDGGFWLKRFGS